MKVQELKYNLYLIDFLQVEDQIQIQFKTELEKYGVLAYDMLPKQDYLQLLRYFTLFTVCKVYKNLTHKKNTILYVNSKTSNPDILKLVKEIKKVFPFLIYITEDTRDVSDPAVLTEITYILKEFRYSVDLDCYSFSKIKKYCQKNKLDNLIADFKP